MADDGQETVFSTNLCSYYLQNRNAFDLNICIQWQSLHRYTTTTDVSKVVQRSINLGLTFELASHLPSTAHIPRSFSGSHSYLQGTH